MRIAYENWKPGIEARRVIVQANAICADLQSQGYDLTLRQLYYQFVAKGLIPNTQQSYKRLGDIVNKARLAGLMDWDYIVDRTRNIKTIGHFRDPAHIISVAARSFAMDKWSNQPVRVEVWVEKEALAGIVGQVAERHDVSWFSCRGYVSQSELWGAAQRLMQYVEAGQRIVVLHLGDHDPSGIDMSRDIEDRLELFMIRDWLRAHPELRQGDAQVTVGMVAKHMANHCWRERGEGQPSDGERPGGVVAAVPPAVEVRRIALNMDQVDEYNPPPNPAKLTDSRSTKYVDEHGSESWELDALDPSVLDELIEEHVLGERDDDLWEDAQGEEDVHRELLTLTSQRWADAVVPGLRALTDPGFDVTTHLVDDHGVSGDLVDHSTVEDDHRLHRHLHEHVQGEDHGDQPEGHGDIPYIGPAEGDED